MRLLLPIPLGWVGVACWGDIWVLLVCLYGGCGLGLGGRGGCAHWGGVAGLSTLPLPRLGMGKDPLSGGSSSRAP